MSTDRQKSFIATIGTHHTLLHFLDVLHAQPAIVYSTFSSGGFFTGRRQPRNDSHFLGLRPNVPVNAWPRPQLYFRFTGSDYRLYIRTPGSYYGKCLSVDEHGLIGAYPVAGSATFNLIDTRYRVVNLDTIEEESLDIYIQVKNSGLLHRHKRSDSKYIYIADQGGTPLLFNLTIQQRNAPYLSSPDEI